MTPTREDLVIARDQHRQWLREQPGIQGSGIGLDDDGKLSIVIFTHNASAATRQAVVSKFPGYPVHFQETGTIRPF